MHSNTAPPLKQIIRQFQLYSLVSVAIFSFLNGFFDSIFYKNTNNLSIEILLILGFFLPDLIIKKRQNFFYKIKMLPLYFSALIGFICINIAFGWALSQTVQTFYASFLNQGDGVIFATLIIGGGWNLPIILYYKKLSAEQKKLTKLHSAMTPVLLAYILLLTPLMVQSIANSPKWDEIKHAPKPIKKAEILSTSPTTQKS